MMAYPTKTIHRNISAIRSFGDYTTERSYFSTNSITFCPQREVFTPLALSPRRRSNKCVLEDSLECGAARRRAIDSLSEYYGVMAPKRRTFKEKTAVPALLPPRDTSMLQCV